MEYILINPFSSGTSTNAVSGVDLYSKTVKKILERYLEVTEINNDENLSRSEFQNKVRDIITNCYLPDEVIIESPECRAPTLLLPSSYRIHLRLHCPSALTQYHDGVLVDRNLLREELKVIDGANVVSSPSFIMKEEVQPLVDDKEIVVFNNPPIEYLKYEN